MKTKTENILIVLKIIALLAGIGYSIECGSQLLSLVASFINPDWAKRGYNVDQDIFSLRDHSTTYYIYAMSLIITLLALKALTWYLIFDLLLKLQLTTPFSMEVSKKLERISYLLFTLWGISIVAGAYIKWLSKTTGTSIAGFNSGDEYFFIVGIVYVISQVFKRGIEIQNENELTI